MIRTLVEIRGGRVSIRETGTGQTEVSVTVDGALSDQDGVADLSAVELAAEVTRLESELTRRTQERDEREQARANLEKSQGEEILKLRAHVAEYDRDRKTERDRADRLQAEVDRLKKGHVCTPRCKPDAHVAFTGRQRLEELERDVAYWREAYEGREKARATVEGSLESARRSVEVMAGQIGRVRAQVMGPEIRRVLDGSDAGGITGQGADLLARRIRNIRDIVASPTPETPSA